MAPCRTVQRKALQSMVVTFTAEGALAVMSWFLMMVRKKRIDHAVALRCVGTGGPPRRRTGLEEIFWRAAGPPSGLLTRSPARHRTFGARPGRRGAQPCFASPPSRPPPLHSTPPGCGASAWLHCAPDVVAPGGRTAAISARIGIDFVTYDNAWPTRSAACPVTGLAVEHDKCPPLRGGSPSCWP
jgi:hypothetical protein